jgi:nucleoside-diphosphate-sugar epimerase
MKILVTGASGFIGKILVKKLKLKYGAKNLICFSRTYEQDKNEDLQFIKGDILNYRDVFKAFIDVDSVIHLVASSLNDPIVKKKTIIDGTKNIVKASKEFKVKKIIFLSSYSASRNNKDATGKAKLESEEIIIKSGIRYTILRPTLIYGKRGRIFNQILKSTEYPFFVPVIGNGKYKIGPVYVKDVCNIIIKVLDKKYDNKTYDVVGKLIRYNNFIKKILKVKEEKKALIHVPLFLILGFVFILNKLRLIKFDVKRILRAVEDVLENKGEVSNFRYKYINLEDGLRKSI